MTGLRTLGFIGGAGFSLWVSEASRLTPAVVGGAMLAGTVGAFVISWFVD